METDYWLVPLGIGTSLWLLAALLARLPKSGWLLRLKNLEFNVLGNPDRESRLYQWIARFVVLLVGIVLAGLGVIELFSGGIVGGVGLLILGLTFIFLRSVEALILRFKDGWDI